MRAPADQTALVSPLTTLVQAQMDLAGGTSAAADKAVQDAAGVAVSMFTDFTQGTDTAALGPIARLVVLAKQGASGALAAVTATPTKDSSGATITTADVDRAVDTRLRDLLPPMVSAVNSDAVTTATGAAKDDAIKAAAQALVTSQLALTAATLPVVIGTARAPDTSAPPTTPIAGASLAWFTYTDASNWYFRYFSSSAAQNTPDANGLQRFVDNRKRSIAGVVQVWGDPAYTRTDTYFNGSTWAVCPTSFENPNTVRDAQGRSESFYCGAYHGSSVRSVVDVAGQRMSEIVTQVRAYPLTNSQGSYPSWGPDPALLGAAVFPANSKLFYQTSTQISNPDAYTVNKVTSYPADVTAGGTPTFDANGVASLACGNVTSANAASLIAEVTALEQLVARMTGTPCIFGPNASAGARNDWWSNSTAQIGTIAGPAPSSSYYQSNRSLRVGFGSANSVTYYNCALRTSDGSSRNCDPVGTGTYSIETVGDARVLRLANPPAIAATLTYSRSYVERGGKVYFGFRDKLKVDHAVRLNADGMDALLGQLGLTR